jgi:hypothetical protein
MNLLFHKCFNLEIAMDSHKDIFIKRVSLLKLILKTKGILNYGQKNKIHTQFYLIHHYKIKNLNWVNIFKKNSILR